MLNFKTNYDVVIIGAGVAGCTAAKYLSKNFSVLLIEKSKIPREKSCGGLLIGDSINFINKENPPEDIFSIPRKLKTRVIDWDNDIEILSGEVWNISRKKLDYWSLKSVGQRVDVLPEALLVDVKKGKEIELAIQKNDQFYIVKAKYLIGADGAWSTVREKAFHKKIKYCLTIQQWIRPSFKRIQTFDFIFYNKITDFYSWIIPKGEYIIVGTGLRPKQRINKKFTVLKEMINKKTGIKGEAIKTEYSVFLTPQSINDITLGEENIILVGEAAGLIGPSDGEGISYALRSGYLCAQALSESLGKVIEDYNGLCQPLLDRYVDELHAAKILFDSSKRPKLLNTYK